MAIIGWLKTIEWLQWYDVQAEPGGVVCLKGNHEDMLLAARARRMPASEGVWLANGGHDCLASFGVGAIEDLPDDVVAWIEACPTVFEDEWRCFVHAGLDPSQPRLAQTDRARLWIREPFLSADHDFGRMIVHGHTPCRSGLPDVRQNRVNLDTGAVYGGPLTAAIFRDGERRPAGFLQVR